MHTSPTLPDKEMALKLLRFNFSQSPWLRNGDRASESDCLACCNTHGCVCSLLACLHSQFLSLAFDFPRTNHSTVDPPWRFGAEVLILISICHLLCDLIPGCDLEIHMPDVQDEKYICQMWRHPPEWLGNYLDLQIASPKLEVYFHGEHVWNHG